MGQKIQSQYVLSGFRWSLQFPVEPSKMRPDTTLKTEQEKEAQQKGSLQFLKSVEGRVLTIMEAAFSDKDQREAIKTLIKKEFRREMNKANRTEDED